MIDLKDAKDFLNKCFDRDNLWVIRPVTIAAVFVILVLVKSYQGIIYYHSDECKIHRLGYPIEQAQLLVKTLSNSQVDSLIARQEHDTIAIPLIHARYFIADNFDRYLAYHKQDTTSAPLSNIIALVNIGADQDRETSSVPCDTSKGQLMLVNGRHYLDENYQPDSLATFNKTYCYEEQRALPVVVDAFMAMQQACKEQTSAQLMVNSAHRSYQQQISMHKRSAKGYAAHAGYSEHQTGLAIDVTSREHPMRWPFDKSEECAWMHAHCHEYGFILRYPKRQSLIFGFAYEPWHLRYVGPEVARRIHDEDITFDEYYAFYLDKK
ncbi:MAG: M15 family metallopeptidase [Bacteroidales bacterium]|nr:M15 family metallopeptidase [Bacteroidales bacterium]